MHEQIIQAVQRKVHSICLQKHYTSIVIIRIRRKSLKICSYKKTMEEKYCTTTRTTLYTQ